MVEETSKDVYLAVNWTMRNAMCYAVDNVLYNAVNQTMSWAVLWIVRHAVRDTVDRAMSDTVHDVVYWDVCDPAYSGLQEFLREMEV